jgi:hypothetical protein
MNTQKLDKKVSQDTARLKNDLSTLEGDSAARFGRFERDVTQASDKAKEDLSKWVDNEVTQINEGIEKFSGDAKEAMVGVTETMKKDVTHGLSQYNAKAQEIANKVPCDFSQKAARYPWVTITVALVLGFLLGGFIKSIQHHLD